MCERYAGFVEFYPCPLLVFYITSYPILPSDFLSRFWKEATPFRASRSLSHLQVSRTFGWDRRQLWQQGATGKCSEEDGENICGGRACPHYLRSIRRHPRV